MTPIVGLFFIFSSVNSFQSYNFNQSSFYAGLSASLATHFHSSCIYFLTDSRLDDTIFLEKVIKQIAIKYGESTNVYSFDEYHQHQENDKTLQCYVPLHVVISHDTATHTAFTLHSQRNTMQGSYSVGGGVWLVFLDSLTTSFLENYFQAMNTPFDVEMVVAELNQNDEMILKEVYRVQKDCPLRYPSFGKWSQKKGLELFDKSHLYSRRRDLEGIELNIGYLESAPSVYQEIINGKPELAGFIGEIWESFEDAFNFTSNATKKKNYGMASDAGKWSGLIGQVEQGNFEAGIADFTLTQKRFEVVSYSKPLFITTFRTYYHSSGSTVDVDALFLPLAFDLWAALIGWLIVTSLLLYVGCFLSDQNLKTSENLTYLSSFFFVAGALCAQGGVNVPKRYACKMLFFSSFLITSVVIPSYSASLLSYLTILPTYVPFTTMKGFYELGNIKMTVKYSSYEYDIFSYDASNDQYMNKIFKRDILPLSKDMHPKSTVEAIRNVCINRNIAFFGLSESVNWAILQEERMNGVKTLCSISNVPHAGKVSIGMIFPKYSHFRGLFNYHLSYLPSNGILKRLKYKHWPVTQVIPTLDNHKPVGLQNLIMIFVILGSGLGGSIIFLILELQIRRNKKSKQINLVHSEVFLDKKTDLNYTLVQRKRHTPESIVFYYY